MRFGMVATLASVVLLSVAPTPTRAGTIGTDHTFGLGLGGGTLTSGLSAKYFVSDTSALQAVLGLNGWGFSFGVDFIHSLGALTEGSAGVLKWGVGGGAGVIFYDVGPHSSTHLGISAILELVWHFRSIPLELVVDWRPTVFIGEFLPGFYAAGGGAAVRWYF